MKKHYDFTGFRRLKSIDDIVESLNNFLENEFEFDDALELDRLTTKIGKKIFIVDMFMAIIDTDKYREQGWYLLFNEHWTMIKKVKYYKEESE